MTVTELKKKRQDKRTTISVAQVVWCMAEEMMAAKGFNDNFSAYVADLVRRDKERAVVAGAHRPTRTNKTRKQ